MATRTWVSGVGDDANPCSRTAPCKTFAGAISRTATGGEIDALDPGGFGAVTITKSITLDGGTGSGWASILASATNGIIINAAGAVVTLRNLSINGAGTGICGIRILSAASVFIEDCVIFGFRATAGTDAGRGISDSRNVASARLFITNVTIRNCAEGAVVVAPVPGAQRITASIDNARFEGNRDGLSVSSGALVTISNTVISGHTGFGMIAQQPAGSIASTVINVENCLVTHNFTGVAVQTGSPVIRLSNTSVLDNATGIALTSGLVQSYVNNKIAANGAGNAPSAGASIAIQ